MAFRERELAEPMPSFSLGPTPTMPSVAYPADTT